MAPVAGLPQGAPAFPSGAAPRIITTSLPHLENHHADPTLDTMRTLLALARLIDGMNERLGRLAGWLVLAAVLISAANATLRYTLDLSSNAWLEIQWYLFSGIFLLGAGYTLLRNAHVRIDILASRWSPRTRAVMEIACTLLFLMPMACVILYFSWPMFMSSYTGSEMSGDAGGLLRWPVKLLIPIGFLFLILQGVAQIVRNAAILLEQPRAPRTCGKQS